MVGSLKWNRWLGAVAHMRELILESSTSLPSPILPFLPVVLDRGNKLFHHLHTFYSMMDNIWLLSISLWLPTSLSVLKSNALRRKIGRLLPVARLFYDVLRNGIQHKPWISINRTLNTPMLLHTLNLFPLSAPRDYLGSTCGEISLNLSCWVSILTHI